MPAYRPLLAAAFVGIAIGCRDATPPDLRPVLMGEPSIAGESGGVVNGRGLAVTADLKSDSDFFITVRVDAEARVDTFWRAAVCCRSRYLVIDTLNGTPRWTARLGDVANGPHMVTLQLPGTNAARPDTVVLTFTTEVPKTEYSVQPLETLGGDDSFGVDLSNAGVAVGWARTSGGVRRAVSWTNGVAAPLSSGDPNGSVAVAVNQSGVIAGIIGAFDQVFPVLHLSNNWSSVAGGVVWQGGVETPLPAGYVPYDVNSAGALLVVRPVPPKAASPIEAAALSIYDQAGTALVYNCDYTEQCRSVSPVALNMRREAAAVTVHSLWGPTAMANFALKLPYYAGGCSKGKSYVYALNEVGQAIVKTDSNCGSDRTSLVQEGKDPVDLSRPLGRGATLIAMSDDGRILSSSLVNGAMELDVWRQERVTTVRVSGWTLDGASRINSAGQILAHGTNGTLRRALLLTPLQ